MSWRLLDEELYTGLATLPERSIATLERAAIWSKGAPFHREPMPPRVERSAWGARASGALSMERTSCFSTRTTVSAKKRKSTDLFRNPATRKTGRAIVFIIFPGRSMTHDTLLRQLHGRLMVEADTFARSYHRDNTREQSDQIRPQRVRVRDLKRTLAMMLMRPGGGWWTI